MRTCNSPNFSFRGTGTFTYTEKFEFYFCLHAGRKAGLDWTVTVPAGKSSRCLGLQPWFCFHKSKAVMHSYGRLKSVAFRVINVKSLKILTFLDQSSILRKNSVCILGAPCETQYLCRLPGILNRYDENICLLYCLLKLSSSFL